MGWAESWATGERRRHHEQVTYPTGRIRRTFYAMTGGAVLVLIGAVVLMDGNVVLGRVLLVFGALGILPVSWAVMLATKDREVRMISALALVTVAFGVGSVLAATEWVFYALTVWVCASAAFVAWRARSWTRTAAAHDQDR